MSKAVLMMIFTATLLLAGEVALAFELTSTWIAPDEFPVLEPDGGFFTAVIGALEYAANAAGSIIQLMAFQADGVAPLAVLVMDVGIFLIVLSMVRGN